MTSLLKQTFFYFATLLFFFSLSSCLNNKNITNFQTLRDSSFSSAYKEFVPKIQKGDILMIIVNSPDPQSSLLFTSVNSMTIPGTTVSPNSVATPGYLVERNGNITVPKIGLVKAEGKTRIQLAQELQDSLSAYLKDPIVSIRFMNYRVTLLGEVAQPGQIVTTNDRLTILEAIGLSGDITTFGNRKNILVIRDSGNITVSKRLDITNNTIFSSQFFYLQSNDVVYVEPLKQKGYSSSEAIILIPIISAVVTTLLLVFNLLKR